MSQNKIVPIAYYTLCERTNRDEPFRATFGSHNREDVSEACDLSASYNYPGNVRIITTGPTQKEINAGLWRLNHYTQIKEMLL